MRLGSLLSLDNRVREAVLFSCLDSRFGHIEQGTSTTSALTGLETRLLKRERSRRRLRVECEVFLDVIRKVKDGEKVRDHLSQGEVFNLLAREKVCLLVMFDNK